MARWNLYTSDELKRAVLAEPDLTELNVSQLLATSLEEELARVRAERAEAARRRQPPTQVGIPIDDEDELEELEEDDELPPPPAFGSAEHQEVVDRAAQLMRHAGWGREDVLAQLEREGYRCSLQRQGLTKWRLDVLERLPVADED